MNQDPITIKKSTENMTIINKYFISITHAWNISVGVFPSLCTGQMLKALFLLREMNLQNNEINVWYIYK